MDKIQKVFQENEVSELFKQVTNLEDDEVCSHFLNKTSDFASHFDSVNEIQPLKYIGYNRDHFLRDQTYTDLTTYTPVLSNKLYVFIPCFIFFLLK